jgi:hypothetical protein
VLKRAEEKSEDTHHALNLLLKFGFERFHVALTSYGAVHSFELGIVRNLPMPEGMDLLLVPKSTQSADRSLEDDVPQGHLYASAFHEPDFQSLPGNSGLGSELRKILEQAIEVIPTAKPFLIKGDQVQDQ